MNATSMGDAVQAPDTGRSLTEHLNSDCTCRFLDLPLLRRRLEDEPACSSLADEIMLARPHLFSTTAVFMTSTQISAMSAIVQAAESVISMPSWQRRVLTTAPSIARFNPGSPGSFLGFDFHLGEAGPQLIEINTNPGGALINLALAQAQRACCEDMAPLVPAGTNLETLGAELVGMFMEEWRRQGRFGQPFHIAIVDEAPVHQYLYPEFLLFQRLFERAGIGSVIADPRDLTWREGRLWHQDRAIDLVYNRLTDFYLAAPESAALRAAYEAAAAVVTPHPRAHVLYADERNLAILTDDEALREIGVEEHIRRILALGVPTTRIVRPDEADALWKARRHLFFKPADGFGSRAAYRGDKVTRKVWGDILAGAYVAQRVVPPSRRAVVVDAECHDLKLDVRAYAYGGQVYLFAARLYSGQTTNFRTPGGGFAPVFVTKDCPEVRPRHAPR